MNPSQQGNSGRQNKPPTAAQIQAFAEAQSLSAGQKRAASEVSDLEVPEGSRAMLGLDRTRHRPNHPRVEHLSSDPGTSLPLSTFNATESPIPHPHSSSPLLSSSPALALKSPNDAMDSALTEPSSAATMSPAASTSLNPKVSSLPSITSESSLDRRSPAIRSMLQEAFNEGRAEGRRENKAKLDEAEAKVGELKKRLDPSKLKVAYDRGWREGGIEGYNKYSLNPETKQSDDRLAFENMCREKDNAIREQQLIMARYQKELMARRLRIKNLEQQANFGTPQPPTQQGQNITGQQIADAEARFSAQGQELEATRAQNKLMRADIANWQVQWGLVTADLEKWKAEVSAKAGQLNACQRQLGHSNGELQKCKARADELAVTNSVETGRLKAATEELESKLSVLSLDFNSLDRLYKTLVQVAAERSAETQLVIEDGKDVNNALTSKNNELTELREQLEKKVGRQAEEIKRFSKENEELKQKLKERDETEDARAPRNHQNSSSQAIDQTTGEIDDLPTNMAQETAAANVELVREVLEREQRAIEAENLRRENRVTATLEEMRETERGRRQLLTDELEDKDAQLYNAQTQIRELTERLLATSPTQPSPTLPSTPFSSSSSPHPPPPGTSSDSPPPETSPSPTEPPPQTISISSTTQPQPSFRLSHIPVANNFSPRRLFIIFTILLLALLLPFLRSPGRPASEDINSHK